MQITVNGTSHQVDDDADTPLLWVLRDALNLTGTKFGCGIAACGACTVLMDGVAVRSCQTTLDDVARRRDYHDRRFGHARCLHAVQEAWLATSGRAMWLLPVGADHAGGGTCWRKPRSPVMPRLMTAMSGNLCRCGTYPRIRAAIHDAAARLQKV